MRSKLFPVALACCVLQLCAPLHAQALPGSAQLGMSVPQLQQAVSGLKPVPHPARMAGGLVGSWSAPAIDVAGVQLVPTFFFAQSELQRIEYLAADGTVAFDTLLAWGRATWGQELASQNPEGAYASWAASDLDAYLQQAAQRVRLVVKRRIARDASEL